MSEESSETTETTETTETAPAADPGSSGSAPASPQQEKPKPKKKKKSKGSGAFPTEVYLRNYSKAVFFYPLMFFSGFAFIVQGIWTLIYGEGATIPWLSTTWVVVFFFNMFVVAFNFSAKKFFILFLTAVVIILVVILLASYGAFTPDAQATSIQLFQNGGDGGLQFDIGLTPLFYGIMFLGLGAIIGMIFIGARVNYVKIEKNEVYVRNLFQARSKRYPTGNFSFETYIVDVFELITMGAGSVDLTFGNNQHLHLETVPLIHRKEDKLDKLLSVTAVMVKN